MAANKDVPVLGSQSAAAAIFLAEARDAANRGQHALSQYWLALTVPAQQSGQHIYPNA